MVDDFISNKLAVEVDKANKAYGHGIARTNDFGFKRGENMHKRITTDVMAALQALKRPKQLL